MKTDKYTKTILTIIAVCLVLIVIKMYPVTTANAGRSETINVNIEKVGGRNVFKSLPVNIEGK